MSNHTLNFSLTTDIDRCMAITEICSQSTFTSKQYAQMADYILLASNKCHPTEPFVYPEEFSNPKRNHNSDSLDEILDEQKENNDFYILESTMRPVQPSIYKRQQRKIDRNNPLLNSNPQLQELWKEIDYIDSILSTTTNHKLSKLSIALHKQQYDILESILPQRFAYSSSFTHQNFYQWYRGIEMVNGEYANIDLTNYNHMAKFLKLFPDLVEYCTINTSQKYMYSDLYQMIQDTKLAIKKASLSPLHSDVLHLYWTDSSGLEILSYIYEKYGKKYNQPTLSTMFNTTIAKKISLEYKEIYEERLFQKCPNRWRRCTRCGTTKYLSSYNFHRASGKPDGYSTICKECSNAIRKIRKEKKNGGN